MGKLFCFTGLLPLLFFGPADQLRAQMIHHMDMGSSIADDRVMTSEVSSIQQSIAKIKAEALKGNLEAINPSLRMINRNWVAVKGGLKVRNDHRSVLEFEQDLKSLGESLEARNETAIIQHAQDLSAAFNDAVHSLERADVDGPKLQRSLGGFMLAWMILTLVAAGVMKRGKIRL